MTAGIRLDLVETADFDRADYPELMVMADNSDGKFEAGDIANAVERGQMQWWVVSRETPEGDVTRMAVVVSEMIQYPRSKAFRFVACVGRHWRQWVSFRDDLRDYAAAHGCDRMELYARPKWGVAFPDYALRHAMFERSVP